MDLPEIYDVAAWVAGEVGDREIDSLGVFAYHLLAAVDRLKFINRPVFDSILESAWNDYQNELEREDEDE